MHRIIFCLICILAILGVFGPPDAVGGPSQSAGQPARAGVQVQSVSAPFGR